VNQLCMCLHIIICNIFTPRIKGAAQDVAQLANLMAKCSSASPGCRGLCLIRFWGSTNTHVININYLELMMKTTQANSIFFFSSLSYVLKNVGLRLKIVL